MIRSSPDASLRTRCVLRDPAVATGMDDMY